MCVFIFFNKTKDSLGLKKLIHKLKFIYFTA